MSGHSKWHKVKHRKAATDSQKSKLFGQLSRDIKSAARQGSDPATNSALREAIERAKKDNLPQANIDRLLHRDATNQQQATYEGYAYGGVAILVQVETDNTNRTIADLRSLFKQFAGRLSEPGSVRWKFHPTRTPSGIVFQVHPHQRVRLSANQRRLLDELLAALGERDDVMAVFTDADNTVN